MAKEKFYITTSIPYLNAAPHLGHALESVQADVIARHQRLRGKDVFFLSGTDEHGAKVMRAAEAAGKTPKKFVDEKSKLFQDLLLKLNISNDDFIRTTDQKRHWPGARLLWQKLNQAGDIYKSRYKGLYCVGHEAFVTDKDLKGGICVDHKKAPEQIEEENYFFKLTKYKDILRKKIETDEFRILPGWRKTETLNMLHDIGDISFSRPSKDISWGVPVPEDTTQTMYVWCDALSSYISALGYGEPRGNAERFSMWWSADVHMVGKDISKFHTIFWPAMLMSAGLSLPQVIFIHGFINIKGEKMSKSTGNVVDPLPLLEKYGKEAVRYYLTHEISTFADGDYTEENLERVYEGSLVNGLGNVVARVAKMMSVFPEITKPDDVSLQRFPIRKNLDFLGTPEGEASFEEISPSHLADSFIWPAYKKEMEKYEISSASEIVFAFLHRLDEYIENYQPYKMKDKPEDVKIILWHLAYSLASAAWMLKPFLPETADKILVALGVDPASEEPWTKFIAKEVPHLFPRLTKK
ncbi:MAG: methionine--tRNA ligase [bacterium]|nr:methionine--tRNA ligase [bacterium]